MAWLRKRKTKKGTVYHIAYNVDGRIKYKSLGLVDEKFAKSVLEKFNADITLEKFGITKIKTGIINKNNKKKLEDFIEEYHSARKHYKDKTRQVDHYSLDYFSDFVGNVNLDSITKFTVEQYKSNRISSVSPTTVNIELRTLKAAFYFAERAGYIKENPFSKTKFLKSSENDLSEFLELSEIQKMRDTIDSYNEHEFRNCFEFYLNTGARRLEGLKTEWKDVNFDRSFIFLRHTKTGKTRMVPMNKTLDDVLKGMYIENKEGNLFGYHPDSLTHKFKKFVKRSNINKNIHFHNLRDTFASHLIMQGVDLLTVSRYLGHSDVKVTEKFYGHLSPGHYREAINKLPY